MKGLECSQDFPYYNSFGAICCYGNQFSSDLAKSLKQSFPHPRDANPKWRSSGILKAFSGIWGHFPECRIFHHMGTKFLIRQTSILPNTVPFSTIPNAWLRALLQLHAQYFLAFNWLHAVRAKDLYNRMNFCIHTTFFCKGIHLVLYHRQVLGLVPFYPLK